MIAIVDTGAANLASVQNALRRLQHESVVTLNKKDIETASHVIIPGVGSAYVAMEQLAKHNLIEVIKGLKQPTLGICLGMQILFTSSQEEDTQCLGIIPGRVEKFSPADDLTIPHMGWNSLYEKQENCQLLQGIPKNSYFYFVHSFFAPSGASTVGVTNHGINFPSVVNQDNFWGVQFHPEKSAQAGAEILRSFLQL